MEKEKLKIILEQECKKYESYKYDELAAMEDPTVFTHGQFNSDDDYYQVEIGLLEQNEEYIHISIAVNDNGMWRTMCPFASSIIVYKKKHKPDDTID